MKKLRHVPTGRTGDFVSEYLGVFGKVTQINEGIGKNNYFAPSNEFTTVIENEYPNRDTPDRDTSVSMNHTEPSKQFYKNPFFWAILILFLAVIFLAYSNRNLRNKIESVEINNRLTETQRKIDSIERAKTAITSKIITNSEDNATRANNLVKSIKNEKPIITDTTHAAMYEYVKNYRPE